MTFPIVAIGSSAGGLEAVSELLTAVPSKSGMAYVLVQHLDPNHASLLPEILTKKTPLPVMPAHEGLALAPNHVYVMPPNVTLTLQNDTLHLTPRESAPTRHMPVDALFKSLAESRGDSAIAVILSVGTPTAPSDYRRSNITGDHLAQEPSTARFPNMPRSAIQTGCVDFVLRPNQIARELARLGGHPYLRLVGAPAAQPTENAPEAASAAEEDSLRRIFRRLRTAHGVDFLHYKRSTLRRRLARRMALQKIEDSAEYVALIEGDPTEAAALYQDFLIRVTGFFRDPDSFEGLTQRIFPSLCEARSPKEPIRVWVPGCATGEEVYSIAIALVEYLSERLTPEGIQIFGTDVSEPAIERARAGVYLDTITQDVSGERLARFFVKTDDHYRIAKSIRDLCIFARQDVTRDPPFSRQDLVSCRNLLIYLDTAAQRRVLQIFHYSLRPRGFLMLGPSESAGQASDLFELSDKRYRVYTRKTTAAGVAVELGGPPYSRPREALADEAPLLLEANSIQREADRLLLARFAPASLLVDEALNILQVRGETGPYLELASGTNEEFQSTNEELETSKEELQSANEELTTTNDELRNRNRELAVLNVEVEKERAASEQARRYVDAIVESVTIPLLVLDQKLQILRANQAYYADLRERREATEGRLFYEVGDGQWNLAPVREQLDQVLTRSGSMTNCVVTHDFPMLGPRVMSLSARKIPADRERAELILLAMEDITERRANSEALLAGARLKDEFLAMLAHELRNPLSPITHAVHLLRGTHADPASVKLYEMIGRQTQRLVRLVDELLDVARISRGLIAVKRERVDLVVIVRQAAEASRLRIEQGHHAFSLVLPDAPVPIDGDSVRLEQVVCNLLENAAKYSNPGGQITLTLTQLGEQAVLSVKGHRHRTSR